MSTESEWETILATKWEREAKWAVRAARHERMEREMAERAASERARHVETVMDALSGFDITDVRAVAERAIDALNASGVALVRLVLRDDPRS